MLPLEPNISDNLHPFNLLSAPTLDHNYDSSFEAVERDPESWAGSLPAQQGLYDNANEVDSCGVGFICHIKGISSHKIVSDARQLLCAMTHRGATGADSRDGDGAGVMTGIPHEFLKREAETDLGCLLPEPGKYAVGNVFFNPHDTEQLLSHQDIFSKIAHDLGLRVLGWRKVPTDGTILGPASKSKEPAIYQPFVVVRSNYGDGSKSQEGSFDTRHFERQLYVLRKHATHTMFVDLICIESLRIRVLNVVLFPVFCLVKFTCKLVLCLLAFDQEHRLQRSTFAPPSLQLLSRPQPRSLCGPFYVGPLSVLHEYLPELGQSSTVEMGCS